MTNIDETVEAVARAIGTVMGDYSPGAGWIGEETHAMGLNRARAAIAAMPSWRPIDENAPKQPEILLYGACRPRNSTERYAKDINVGWWNEALGQWSTRIGGEVCDATHWMLLPPKPEGERT